MALTQGAVETVAVAAGLAVGALYSLPPFRLKRFPVAASLCITGVRSLVVNLGVYWHFAGDIAPPVWALCLFVLPFSFAIAVLKDVPDLEGDRQFSIRTFTVRLGAERVFSIGLAALAIAYGGMIVLGPLAARRLRAAGGPGGRPPCRRGAALVLVATGRSARPRGLHALLHARLGALLPGVRAGPARLPRDLTFWLDVRARTKRSRLAQEAWTSLHARGRFVGNVDCLFGGSATARGQHSGDPHQALRPAHRAEHHHGLPGARRTAAGGQA